ncbi:MAG: penicillin-insensitive murein endopeptidase [Acetobacteraceae bacterium]|nr:penicillin-insensitive murein endopeptidase [Acetobacteraceae bacterium]
MSSPFSNVIFKLPVWGLMLALAAAGPAPDEPAPGPVHIIGGAAIGGCFTGGVRLPDAGPGFQVINKSRSSFWGTPDTIARIELLGRLAQSAGLPDLLVGDISGPRGGPLPGGHVSHQIGLDADIGLNVSPTLPATASAGDDVELPSLVRPDQREVDPSRWSDQVIKLLQLAAGLPGVDRILVNPAIKRQLCTEVRGDRTWLRLIRPWYGHAAHMHIRFRCPPDQRDCVQSAPPPEGDGCDATLQWWFDRLDNPAPPAPAPKPPPLPAACKAVMEAG